jgi:hypothetical protein
LSVANSLSSIGGIYLNPSQVEQTHPVDLDALPLRWRRREQMRADSTMRAAEVSREACNNAELKRQEKKRHNSDKARLKDRRIPHLDAARKVYKGADAICIITNFSPVKDKSFAVGDLLFCNIYAADYSVLAEKEPDRPHTATLYITTCGFWAG